ncbi:nitronate monooxygenase, partial [Mycobacterium sp. NAZ190054]|uniref:nitronate monooxygenase n=1 Tax=Mycobacterium sp. NAZ190054 TaxID=1747766 RepID=UPI000A8D52EA
MNLDVPIVNAPMGGVAGGALAAAVSRAGALGMIGIGSSGSAAQLRRHLTHTANLQRPFGIGLISWVVEKDPALLGTALEARPALLSVSFGDDWSWVARAHDAGCVTATQVADLDAARRAVDGGVQVLVTRGAQHVVDTDTVAPDQTALWGFGRAAALELPHLWGGLADLT